MEELYRIIKEVFNIEESVQIKKENGPGSLPGWDSLGHVNLMNAIESKYNISIDMDDMIQIESVSDIEKILIKNIDIQLFIGRYRVY